MEGFLARLAGNEPGTRMVSDQQEFEMTWGMQNTVVEDCRVLSRLRRESVGGI